MGQQIHQFDNGYGASVIDDGYGREDGLYELAVLDAKGHIVYDTPITRDVLGWLTADEVKDVLADIQTLPPRQA